MSTFKTPFNLMNSYYNQYEKDTAPCKYGYKNQCAIRLSLALVRCGFSLDAFPDQKRVHRGRGGCNLGDEPHIVGADELHKFLMQVWDAGLKGKGKDIKSQILGKQGIVYFNNCFKRNATDTSATGDHIDLWNGEKYYNQILGIGAGGDATAKSDLFTKAQYVRFFGLPY
ncbi:MAG TPA: T6SS effector amidase Tae4 family protein [Pyrinomonadaceae bacterium]|jgi:hypothetical protein